MPLTDQLDSITQTIETEFGSMNSEKLNWRSDAESWSIAQCIDHIIVSNEKYFPILEKVISGKHKMTFWEKNSPLTSYTGKQMIRTLGPVILKKFKSPKLFLPSKSSVRNSIIKDFTNHQNKLVKIYSSLEKKDISKIVVTSPVAALLSLKVSDVLQILVVHEQRHLNQMLRIKKQLLG